MSSINIAYWGHSKELLKTLTQSDMFSVEYVVVQAGKFSDEFKQIADKAKLPIMIVKHKRELVEICCEKSIDKILVYCFGIIIPADLYQNYTIINIHPGNLLTNRGAHSILWSVLMPGLGAEITAYRICSDEVDSGEVIVSVKEPDSDEETPRQLLDKLEKNLPWILNNIYKYLSSGYVQTKMVTGGIYRERVQAADYTLDIEHDTKQILKRKINSQAMYDGAILMENGMEIRIKEYIDCGEELILIDSKGVERVIAVDKKNDIFGGGYEPQENSKEFYLWGVRNPD